MKTLTAIDLFVQALLIFGLLGSGAATVFNSEYAPSFFLLLFATGIWQLASAVIGSFYFLDKYKSIFLAASIIYCCFLVFVGTAQHFPTSEQYASMAQVTFLGIIPVLGALLYFYLCVEAFDRRMAAKKDGEFV